VVRASMAKLLTSAEVRTVCECWCEVITDNAHQLCVAVKLELLVEGTAMNDPMAFRTYFSDRNRTYLTRCHFQLITKKGMYQYQKDRLGMPVPDLRGTSSLKSASHCVPLCLDVENVSQNQTKKYSKG
jgi:hypothetical protein